MLVVPPEPQLRGVVHGDLEHLGLVVPVVGIGEVDDLDVVRGMPFIRSMSSMPAYSWMRHQSFLMVFRLLVRPIFFPSPRHNAELEPTRRVVAHCRSGARAALAAVTLEDMASRTWPISTVASRPGRKPDHRPSRTTQTSEQRAVESAALADEFRYANAFTPSGCGRCTDAPRGEGQRPHVAAGVGWLDYVVLALCVRSLARERVCASCRS